MGGWWMEVGSGWVMGSGWVVGGGGSVWVEVGRGGWWVMGSGDV